jgi:hypothetical protein
MSYLLTYTGPSEPVKTIMHSIRVEWGDKGDEEEVVVVEMQYPTDEYPYLHSMWDWAQNEPNGEVMIALDLNTPREVHKFLQECVKLIETEDEDD